MSDFVCPLRGRWTLGAAALERITRAKSLNHIKSSCRVVAWYGAGLVGLTGDRLAVWRSESELSEDDAPRPLPLDTL